MNNYIQKWMPPEEVASFATYLAHESSTVTGEAFAVGGGVVTRVVQAETAGVKDEVTLRPSGLNGWTRSSTPTS